MGDGERWKAAALGTVGGIAGVMAMEGWRKGSKYVKKEVLKLEEPPKPATPPEPELISLVGKQHREGEPATEALGRILYRMFTGKEPETEETKKTLSTLVHWGFGMKMGAWYGLVRGRAEGLDAPGGAMWGVALWVGADELGVPLMGLANAPGSYPASVHAETLGMHIAYGVATAAVTQLLLKVVP